MQLPLITTCGRKKELMKERERYLTKRRREFIIPVLLMKVVGKTSLRQVSKKMLFQSSTEFKLMHHFINAALRCPISLKQMTVVAQ